MKPTQLDLLEPAPSLPAGLDYRTDFLSPEEESALVERVRALEFKEFEFHGYEGKRRVVSFGFRYDYNDGKLRTAGDIPAFLLPLRERAADFAGIPSAELVQALVTEYAPGAGIGWHRDRPVFDKVIGISLVSPCRFRLRRRADTGWERASLILAPRSAYVLQGPVRTAWEHSIPAAEQLRYSITFRSMKRQELGPKRA
jgi:alkylated DNA repair dioxygenase AlkB